MRSFVYSLADAKSTQLTDGMSDARYPGVRQGREVSVLHGQHRFGPSLEPDIRSVSRPVSRSIYLAVLSKTEPSPFAPESDEEKIAEKGEPKKEGDASKPDEQKPADATPADDKASESKPAESKPVEPKPSR